MSSQGIFHEIKSILLEQDIAIVMIGILASIIVIIGVQLLFQTRDNPNDGGVWLPKKNFVNENKHAFEVFALYYTVVWIGVFAVVIVLQMYESFDERSYMSLCCSLAAPFLLQPIVFPLASEKNLPLWERYSFKANAWIAIFSFIGNYWYTHYFYSVLRAKYTFPSWRLNDVPIPLFFATHFYFVTYHTFSNMILRKIETRYAPGTARTVLFWSAVIAFSYFTAFMETLTISSFPYYSFEDRHMAYTVGSAFYGIYFLVSFPVFYRLDEKLPSRKAGAKAQLTSSQTHTLYQTLMEALGASMLVLCLLDFARLAFHIDLNIPGKFFYLYKASSSSASA